MVYFVDAIGAMREADGRAKHLGKFEKLDEAVLAAQEAIDKFLAGELRADMTAKVLFSVYEERGLFPFIFLDNDENTFNVRSFNHFQYALKRCGELCQGTGRG